MTHLQKQTLDGPDKYQSLGALSRKNNELLTMYASNKIPVPTKSRAERVADRLDRKRKHLERRSEKKTSSRRHKRSRTDRDAKSERKRPDNVEKKAKVEKGEHGAHISKVTQADLQQIVAFANRVRTWF